MKKIKILFDFQPALEQNKVGIPIFVQNIYAELKKHSAFKLYKSGIFPNYISLNPSNIFIRIKPFYYKLLLPIRLLLGNYDIYIENSHVLMPYFIPKKTKVIMVIHDIGLILYDDIQSKKQTENMRELLPISIHNSDLIITVSESSKKDIEKYLAQINIYRPIEVIYNAPELTPVPKIDLLKFNIGTSYFLFLGTLEPRKNPLQMIKGFHKFVNKYDSNKKLVIAGKKGWLYDDVMHYIKQNSLEDKVLFTGYITEEEKYWFIKDAVGFIFLSKYEGFGIPPLEALSLGTPVLLSDIPVFHELFEDDAIYVDASSSTAISDGMYQLLTTKDTGRYKCLEKFNWQASGKKLSNIIIKLAIKEKYI